MRPARTAHICVEADVVSAGHDELRESGRRQLGERQLEVEERPPAAEHRHERHGGRQHLRRELVGVAADGFQEADDPLVVGDVLVPQDAHLIHQRLPSGIVLGWQRAGASSRVSDFVASGRRAAASITPSPP